MLKTLPLVLLLAVVHCQMQNNGNMASTLQGIFGTPPSAAAGLPAVDLKGPSTLVPPINSQNRGKILYFIFAFETWVANAPSSSSGDCWLNLLMF